MGVQRDFSTHVSSRQFRSETTKAEGDITFETLSPPLAGPIRSVIEKDVFTHLHHYHVKALRPLPFSFSFFQAPDQARKCLVDNLKLALWDPVEHSSEPLRQV